MCTVFRPRRGFPLFCTILVMALGFMVPIYYLPKLSSGLIAGVIASLTKDFYKNPSWIAVLVVLFYYLIILMSLYIGMKALFSWLNVRFEIHDDHIYVSEYKFLFHKIEGAKTVSLEGIQTVQFRRGIRPDLYEQGQFMYSEIRITRFGESPVNLLTMWFSDKQCREIVRKIKEKADTIYNCNVEILKEEINDKIDIRIKKQ